MFRTFIKTALAVLLLAAFAPQQVGADASPVSAQNQDMQVFCEDLYDGMNFYFPDENMPELFRITPILHIDDISRIDGRRFEFDVSYLLYLAWSDQRVVDLLKRLGRYDQANVEWLCDWPQDQVWGSGKKLFDPVIEFKRRHSDFDFDTDRADYVEIYSDGTIVARTKDFGTFRTSFDLRAFPFDTQELTLVLESEFNANKVSFDIDAAYRQLQAVVPLEINTEDFRGRLIPEWEITDIRHRVEDQHLFNIDYSLFVKEIEVRRKAGYYVVKIFLPMMFLFALCWSVFWMQPSEIQAKTNVTIVAFLSLIAYHLSLSNELPRVNYLTFIDAFIFLSYLFTGSATFFCILLHNLHESMNTDRIVYYVRFLGPVLYLAGIALITLYYLVAF